MRVIDMTLTDNLKLTPGFCVACRVVDKCHRGGELEHITPDGVCDQEHDKLELAPMMPLKTEKCPWEGTWEEWVTAYRIWKKFQENLANNLRVEGLTESDAAIKEAIEDCEVTAAREVHGNYSIFVGSKGADPGPEIFAWLDKSGELQAAENLDESEIERDISPEYLDEFVLAQGKQGPHDEPWGIE